MLRTRGLTFLIAAVLLGAATVKPEVYRNEEFGIAVPVPKGALLCPTPDDEHDHGPVFLLGTAHTKGCSDSERRRSIGIFAGYNVDDATKKLHDLLKSDCAEIGKGPCRPAPRGLQIAGLRSEAARVNHRDGWIDIFVVTQAGTPDPTFDPSVPSINYELSLHTRARYLDQDLRAFRAVLGTVRLSPP